jgi:RNA polymerase sigma-70 factor (ECF subfamily)
VVEGPPPEEAALVDLARRGDAAAYARLVRMHEQIAFRTAFLITGSAAEAEEAAQTAFLKAHRALARFRRGAPLRPWLLRIVANEARNRRRSARRRELLAERAALELPALAHASSPEGELLAAEERRALLTAVGRLRAEERLAVAARYFLGLSEAETAAVAGCAPGTVKSRLSRALARLREDLEAADA